MQRLHELIIDRRAEIIARWTDSVRENLAPEGITRLELIDHLPAFLNELAQRLAERTGETESQIAARHGVQRLRLGFDLSALVREYGLLRQCLMAMTREAGITVHPTDWDVLFEGLISGIAAAVTQYAEEREADRRRQTNQHFAFIAHELRNPLQAAQLSLGTLSNRGLLPESRSAQVLRRSLTRVQHLIEQSLGQAFLAAGIALERSAVRLSELIEEATLESGALAEDKGIELVLPPPNETTLTLDRKVTLSALNNLLRNAVKFTPPGGRIALRLRQEEGHVSIEVEDSCGGIAAESLETLFAPSSKAAPTAVASGSGSRLPARPPSRREVLSMSRTFQVGVASSR